MIVIDVAHVWRKMQGQWANEDFDVGSGEFRLHLQEGAATEISRCEFVRRIPYTSAQINDLKLDCTVRLNFIDLFALGAAQLSKYPPKKRS